MKRINGEDTTTISPTLGFNIKTMQFKRRAPARRAPALAPLSARSPDGRLSGGCGRARPASAGRGHTSMHFPRAQLPAEHLGRGRPEDAADVLAQLL